MNKLNYYLSALLAIAVLGFSSCSDDDDPVVQQNDGLLVADGFYITESGVDPIATSQLKSAMVDAPSFGAMSREGFVQTYAFLTAGDYNLVKVVSKEITETYGGAVTFVEPQYNEAGDAIIRNGECESDAAPGFNVVDATLDGAAFSIASDGLYVVAYDATMGEIIYDKIESIGIIGDATEGGWGSDTPLTGSIASDGASWEGTGIILSPGSFKFRFNCRWAIDRRIDPLADFDNANGYSFFTNYGNSIDNLLAGNEGPNIEISERAEYTVTFTWNPITGVSGTVTRTGDAPALSYDPADHPWSVRGEVAVGSPSDWSSGPLLTPNHDGTTVYRWYGVIRISAGTFKISDGTNWVGFSGITDNSGLLTEASSDNNIEVSAANEGFYYISVTTDDEGATAYDITIDKASFGIIGSATPGGWDASTAMTESGSSWTITTDLVDGEWKFRANDAWEYNLGGDLTGLSHNGDNIAATAGNYTITLTTADRGETYTATVE